MGRWNEPRYERVVRYPLGRAPRPYDYDDQEELSHVRQTPVIDYRPSFDDFDAPAGVPRRRFRRMAWRFIGAVAIGGAFYGISQIAIYPDARRAIADWVTLGHAERTLGRWLDKARQP